METAEPSTRHHRCLECEGAPPDSVNSVSWSQWELSDVSQPCTRLWHCDTHRDTTSNHGRPAQWWHLQGTPSRPRHWILLWSSQLRGGLASGNKHYTALRSDVTGRYRQLVRERETVSILMSVVKWNYCWPPQSLHFMLGWSSWEEAQLSVSQ